MEIKKALIFGITGMDGSHLADLLLEKGYDVHGVIRRTSTFNTSRIDHIFNKLTIHYGDITDPIVVYDIISRVKPNEVYNLAAQSHVRVSFDEPYYTSMVDGIGTLNVVDAIKKHCPNARLYQASTSELYGGLGYNQPENGYNEESIMHPKSPYGVAKMYGLWITRNYRESYGMYISNGILFNHEGERRGDEFVTRKVTIGLSKIYTSIINNEPYETLKLGNLYSKRDWGYAPDFVEGMWLMLQQQEGKDYVLATNETHSIKEFIECVCEEYGLKISWEGKGSDERGIVNGKVIVEIDKNNYRPSEVNNLLGDYSKAKRELGWEPRVKFKELAILMANHDLRKNQKIKSINMKIIKDYNSLSKIVDSLKVQGKKVIFKSGCFDILHIGHIKMLQEAKRIADILIVGVGNDNNITKYKRKMVYDQNNRIQVLSELNSVDYVILLDEPMVGTIDHGLFLEKVKPDYYYLPPNDVSLIEKRKIAERLGIKVVIEDNVKVNNFNEVIEPHCSDILNVKLYYNKIEKEFENDFKFLKDVGRLTDDWSNVYEHCRMEAYIAMILSRILDLSSEDMDDLIKSAILHDWYKRIERESENYETSYSYDKLVECGYSEKIASISHSVGHTSLNTIESKPLLNKLMHFIDDIVSGTSITEISNRVEETRNTGRYKKLEEDYKVHLNGRSFFDVQIEVGEKIQNEIENLSKIPNGELVKIIKEKYYQIMREIYNFKL